MKLRTVIQAFILILVAFNMSEAQSTELGPDVVDSVDPVKYQGTWYEVARIPPIFQKQCEKNTQANYKLDHEGRLDVLNSCITREGELSSAKGKAKIVDNLTNAKLKVTFVKIFSWIFSFGGDLWILDLGEDYEYSVVGTPSRKYAWLLSRTPMLAPEKLYHAAKTFHDQGYDICQIITSNQDGGIEKQISLCELYPDIK